jgi:predicted ester cyclase
MLRGFIGALPDLHASEQDIVAAGETVVVRYVVEATHQGIALGSPVPVAGCAGTLSTSTTSRTG